VKILSRYVLREHLGPLAFALTALTSLLLLNFIAKRFGDLVGKGLPASVIAEFFGLAIPFTVAMTLPMAVLVAVLYAFSRLASESEITALKASGVSMGRILRPVLAGATVLAIAMVYFNDYVLPAANHRLRILQTDIGRTKPTFALREQVINDVVPGKLFLRAGRIDKARNRMFEVVIYDFGDGSKRRTIVADSGDLVLEGSGDLALMLYHGTMTEIPANMPTQLSRLSYATDKIVVRGVANSFSRDSADSYKSEREMGVCEMQAQVYGAEKDLYRETRSAAMMQQRALKALTRGVVDSLAPIDSLRKPSPGIGRYYCEATAAVSALFKGGDSTTKGRGTPTNAPLTASPTIAPVVTPNDAQAKVVPAGVPAADSASRAATSATLPAARKTGMPRPTSRGKGTAAQSPVKPPAPAMLPESPPMAALTPPTLSPPPLSPPAIAPSSGAVITQEPQSLLPVSTVTPSMASTGIGSIIEQTIQRASIARSTWSQYEVEIHKKFSLAVACIVFVLLGAPIALRFPRGGVGLVIGASLGVFALYYICLIAGESMADDGVLPPWVAMWAANLVFTAVGIVLFLRMGREGSTARGGDLDDVKDRIIGWFASLRPAARKARSAPPVPATDR
jgi:lipopolysaccharide export system permease protein